MRKNIKIHTDLFLAYELRKDGSCLTLYRDNLDCMPSIVSINTIKDLILDSIQDKDFNNLNKDYINNVIKDIDNIKRELESYSSSLDNKKEYPDSGFGDSF